MKREGWSVKRLGEVCEVLTDGDWIESKDQSPEGIRLIQTGNIGNGVYKDKTEHSKFVSDEIFKRLNCTEIFEGDILVSRLPDPIGRACIIPKTKERMITAVDCSIIRLKDILVPKFLVYYTLSREYNKGIERYITGAVRKRISRANLSNIPIPIPPLPEQSLIVSELDELTSLLDKKRQQLLHLDTLAQSIFYDMFGDPVANERGWEVKRLGEVCEILNGRNQKKVEDINGKYPIYGSGGIMGYANDYICRAGTTIIGRKGSINKPLYVDKDFWNVDTAFGLQPKECCNSRFLFYLCKSIDFTRYDKGVTIPSLVKSDLLQIPISIPPFPLQHLFAQKVEAIEQEKALIKQSIKEVQELLDSRMEHYFGVG